MCVFDLCMSARMRMCVCMVCCLQAEVSRERAARAREAASPRSLLSPSPARSPLSPPRVALAEGEHPWVTHLARAHAAVTAAGEGAGVSTDDVTALLANLAACSDLLPRTLLPAL